MNARRFYFVMTIFISLFLFTSGLFLLKSYDITKSAFAFYENDNETNIPDYTKEGKKNKRKENINVVLLVGDKWECNTDTIVVASYNPDTRKLNLLAIPRDTKVDVSGMKIPKVNALYSMKNGSSLLMNVLTEKLNINIHYYIYFQMSTFREIIDLLGGVDIDIPVDMNYDDPAQDLHIHFRKGLQHLDGKKAELYLRFRKPNNSEYTDEMLKYYDGSDISRIEAQKKFIKELVKQKANLFYLTKLTQIVNTIYENLETNITLDDALNMIKYGVNFSPENIETFSLPGKIQAIDEYDFFISDHIEISKMIQNNFARKEE